LNTTELRLIDKLDVERHDRACAGAPTYVGHGAEEVQPESTAADQSQLRGRTIGNMPFELYVIAVFG
jgi:hypothetical protein